MHGPAWVGVGSHRSLSCLRTPLRRTPWRRCGSCCCRWTACCRSTLRTPTAARRPPTSTTASTSRGSSTCLSSTRTASSRQTRLRLHRGLTTMPGSACAVPPGHQAVCDDKQSMKSVPWLPSFMRLPSVPVGRLGSQSMLSYVEITLHCMMRLLLPGSPDLSR